MKQRFQTLCMLILFTGLTSCIDEESPAKELGPFDRISSNGGVEFIFIQGVENKVVSTSLNESLYNVSNGQHTVNSTGGSMTIAVININLLSCNACEVTNSEPLIVDTLNFSIHAGGLELHNVQANQVSLSAINTGTYELSGNANFLDLSMVNNTYIKAYDFITDSAHVNSTAAVNSEIHATQVLDVSIHSAGNIYYKGNPPVVRVSSTGTGNAIPK